jgi:hypothetical protein
MGRVPLHPGCEGRHPRLTGPHLVFLVPRHRQHGENQGLNDNRRLFPWGGIKRQSFRPGEAGHHGRDPRAVQSCARGA